MMEALLIAAVASVAIIYLARQVRGERDAFLELQEVAADRTDAAVALIRGTTDQLSGGPADELAELRFIGACDDALDALFPGCEFDMLSEHEQDLCRTEAWRQLNEAS